MFNINSMVTIRKQSAPFDDTNWSKWILENAPKFAKRRHAMGILPGRAYTILAKGPHWSNEKENLYLCSARRSSFVIVVPEQELIPADNIKITKEKRIMGNKNRNDESESVINAARKRRMLAEAFEVIVNRACEAGVEKPHELTLEQIFKRVNDHIVGGDIVRITDIDVAIINGDALFDDDISGLVRFYPYMVYPRKNITGEVIKVIPDKEEDIYVIKDYKGRVWLVYRSGIERVKGE